MTIQGQKVVLSGESIGTLLEDLAKKASLDAKAPIDSPHFTGVPTAPTADSTDDSDQLATTGFVKDAIGLTGTGHLPLAGGTMSGPIIAPNGSAGAPSYSVGGATTGVFAPSASTVGIATGGVERFRADSTGFRNGLAIFASRLGTTSLQAIFQVLSTFQTTGSLFGIFGGNANGATRFFSKSRNTTIGSHTIVINNDNLGNISWGGSDGTKIVEAARINVEVDAVPAADTVSGRILFHTTPNTALATPIERMRINKDGDLQAGGANTFLSAARHFQLRSYTNATKPSASPAGQLIYISDVDSGKLAQSNGSVWAVMGANPATGDFVAKGGDVMSGLLELFGDPPVGKPLGAATRQMVDAKVGSVSPALTGTPTVNGSPIATTATLASYLPKAGGDMTGLINMGGFQITNAGSPTIASSLTRKDYVDDADALLMPKTGGAFSGAVTFGLGATFDENTTFNDEVIINFPPLYPPHAATKGYVDTNFAKLDSPHFIGLPLAPTPLAGTAPPTQIATVAYVTSVTGGPYILKAGDTMGGALLLPITAPSANEEATHKKYVNDEDNKRVKKTGDVMSGALILPLPTDASHATNRSYVNSEDFLRMPKTGGNFTGVVTFSDTVTVLEPAANNQPVTKLYADTYKAPKANAAFTGTMTLNGAAVATQSFVTGLAYMPKAGGTFTGPGNVHVQGALTVQSYPSASNEVANRGYVDQEIDKCVAIDGSTPMTGKLTLPTDTPNVPTANGDAIYRKYLTDNYVPKIGGTFTGGVTVENNLVVNRDGDADDAYLFLNSDAGKQQEVVLRSGGETRWTFGAGISGNFTIQLYDPSGLPHPDVPIPFEINRSTGLITIQTQDKDDNSERPATTAYVKANLADIAGVTFASKVEAAGGVNTTKSMNSQLSRVSAVAMRGNNTFSEIDTTGSAPLGWTQTGITVADGGIYGAQRLQAVVTTAGGFKTAIEDQFIPVDPNRLYCLKGRVMTISGNPTYALGLECYNAVKTLITTKYPAGIGKTVTLGNSRIFSGVITATGNGHHYLDPDTRYVKRIWHVSGDGSGALDHVELQEVQPANFLTANQFGFIPGHDKAWNSSAFSEMFDWLISEGGTIFMPAGTYDINAGISKSTPTVVGYRLFGDGVRTRIRRASAWWGDFIEVYGDYIELSNFWVDGNRTSFKEEEKVNLSPEAAEQLGHMLSIRNGSHQRLSKMLVTNWSRNTGIFMDSAGAHSEVDNWIDDCVIDGMNYAGDGFLMSQMDYSGMRHCTARDVNNSATAAGEYVPTPCLGLQWKYDTIGSVIEDCLAIRCRSGLKFAGTTTSTSDRSVSARLSNIGIKAALSVSSYPIDASFGGGVLTNIPIDIRTLHNSEITGIVVEATGATSPDATNATVCYLDGEHNKVEFKVRGWNIVGSSILQLGSGTYDNIVEFSHQESIDTGVIELGTSSDRNLIEVGARNTQSLTALMSNPGYITGTTAGNVIRRKAS